MHNVNGLIMCHPGKIDALLQCRDSTIQSRLDELLYFQSNEMLEDIEMSHVEISRFVYCNPQYLSKGNQFLSKTK